ncbi:GIY-YIG nuclease family protein [Patescibacteria group bacterium]|nr:GIY-YIG nuclease family protein [Patescibacteria group bacterium]MBU4082717.1 GIY-YIG nuclease family protein [Patescibacteria group bacterium]MCG2809163.1 GIY-YIG nuclease family protein [Candidatus Portnoybacteria bacterium]
MYYFYILQSQKNNFYYYGSTGNLQRRLKEHNNGVTKATRNKGPWSLVYFEKYKTLSEARKREYQIKAKKRKSYAKWLIDNMGP